jgi:hypothetical protein
MIPGPRNDLGGALSRCPPTDERGVCLCLCLSLNFSLLWEKGLLSLPTSLSLCFCFDSPTLNLRRFSISLSLCLSLCRHLLRLPLELHSFQPRRLLIIVVVVVVIINLVVFSFIIFRCKHRGDTPERRSNVPQSSPDGPNASC